MRHKHSVTEDPIKVIGIAALAASIGAIVAMLVTPRSGGQVRSGLKRRASHLKDEVQEHFDSAADNTEDLQAAAEQAVKTTKAQAAKTASKAKTVKRQVTKPAAKPATSRRRSQ